MPGGEVAGVVRTAPAGAGVKPGDRVAGLTMLGDGMAEVAAVRPDLVFPLPDNISMTAGAGLLFNDLTVDFALADRGRLSDGETVLVHGAAGGIGTSALRLAPAYGAVRTIAIVSTKDKAGVARAAGASEVVLVDGWLRQGGANSPEGRGVDVVVDPVGGDRFTDEHPVTRPRRSGARTRVHRRPFTTVKVNRLLLNNVEVVGVGWGTWWMQDTSSLVAQWERLRPLLASGKVPAPQPVVRPFGEAADAIASLDRRSGPGQSGADAEVMRPT